MTSPDDNLNATLSPARRLTFTAVWWALLIAGLIAFRGVLVPFVMAVVIAYVLSPVAAAFCRVKIAGRAPQRWIVVLSLYLTILTVLAVTITVAIPALTHTVRSFARNEVPRLRTQYHTQIAPRIRSLTEQLGVRREPTATTPPGGDHLRIEPSEGGSYRVILPANGITMDRVDEDSYRLRSTDLTQRTNTAAPIADRVQEYIAEHSSDLVRYGGGIVGGVVGGVFRFFITLMLSAYILLTEAEILGFLRSLVQPRRRTAFDELLTRLDRGLSGVVRGQLVICLVNGLLSGVGFALAKLPYWPLLTAIATIFSLIPIFGAFLSSIPAVLLGLRAGVGTSLFVLVWIAGIHQLEANLLNPKILGDAAKIHPVLVVFSLLAGEHFFGIMGALLAVPTMSIAQSLFLHWRKYALGEPDDVQPNLEPATSEPPP
ncbi:MAG: AI-2E family transporter [Deltaproteobacteria bacterium]|nr:AI-2E family transporter [Deltaproteobacteria bacterium]